MALLEEELHGHVGLDTGHESTMTQPWPIGGVLGRRAPIGPSLGVLKLVAGTTTFTDPAGGAGDTYVVRWFQQGPHDITCQ
ncbi:MAG: hypothetical protein GY929_01095 [Actinomycetia bacterium]|nr:hypothetical protein [Actinomycetes bacterium]